MNAKEKEIMKAIINMGVFVEAAKKIGLSLEEIKDIISYIAEKRKEAKS